MWAHSIPRFNPQRMSGRSLVSPPGGSGIPHGKNRRFPEPPHGWVLVLTHHLAAAVDRVGAKTETQRELGRLLASPTTGYWSNPPRRGGFQSGQHSVDEAKEARLFSMVFRGSFGRCLFIVGENDCLCASQIHRCNAEHEIFILFCTYEKGITKAEWKPQSHPQTT
ncbi:hypothetical protein XU18_2044 [Perkinsela sp. CCAP 1560/4]|nr:hypothetical protein XU18_2044 [Perkinsela sp. CCAP 1560/4]|eukprot:KNH07512.1 hypothetical protein XU18_2044 [Perkinsela sp. CCAP 1560/4]